MTTTGSATTQAEVLLSTLPITTVPPENYRFIPGSVTLMNDTSATNIANITNGTATNLKSPLFNGTGYFIEDEVEPGLSSLSELQTLFLACVATFIPLIISLFAGFGIRMLWRKYRRYRECNNYDGDVLHRDESSEPMSKPLCSHLLGGDQMKCSETQLSITADDMEICDGTTTITNGPHNTRSTSHSSTNGSIITMTLKNNHLIVETEERNDLEEDSRETTMKYSPGARDGVFVVEVQQGSRRSPGSGGTSLAVDPEPSVSISDQCALVHHPPDRYSDEDTLEECDEYYVETTSPSRETPSSLHSQLRTGLTQSNSSLSSSSTQTYRYGSQQGYESGYYGYPMCNGYVTDEPIRRPEVATNKPKIISEIFKNRSDSKCGPDPPSDGPLLSDVQMSETSRRRSKDEDDDPIQEEQIRLGNAVRVEANVESVDGGGGGGGAKEPRMADKIRPGDKGGLRKLEKLQQNDISPSLAVAEADVRSAEYENKGFESTDLTKT